jgi:sugar O-acyltransferase (sialic acid O-acetyltransferase NeuD family)
LSPCKQKIFVFGASGHAKVVVDVLEKQGLFEIVAIVDDNKQLKGETFYDYPVIGGKEELLQLCSCSVTKGVVAIGNNEIRCAISDWLEAHRYELISAVHPAAQIGRAVHIGAGSVVMANAVVNPSTTIGKNVIVNTGATVEHDCIIGDAVHLAPGSVVCGTVQIGKQTFLGAGSIVIQNRIIGNNVLIGAGTTVYRNIPDESRVVGVR